MRNLSRWAARWALCAALLLGATLGATAQPAPSVERLVEQGTQAGIEAALMQRVVRQAEQAGLSEAQTAQLLNPAVQLAQHELPAQGVLQKALEGLAKNVPPPNVQSALQRMQTHTEQAGTLVRTWSEQPSAREMMGGDSEALAGEARDHLIQSAAQARMQEVPSGVVQQLLETVPAATKRRPIPAGEVAVTLQVLPEFMESGASPNTTIELLTSALDAGYGTSNLRQLPTAMRVGQEQSRRPADAVVRGATKAIAQGTPAADVLSRLFDGGMPGGGPPGKVGPPDGRPPGQGKPPGRGNAPDTPPGHGDDPPGRGNPPDTPPGHGDDPPGRGQGNRGGGNG